MKWEEVLTLLGDEPLFDSSMLLAGDDSPAEIRRQLSRWVASGRLIQLRRGLYAFAPPYARTDPHPFTVASRLRRPSYISLQSALAFHGVIPEAVPAVTSVTTGRSGKLETAFGTFIYRHLRSSLFWGYRPTDLGPRQDSHIATGEKALLDLFYLVTGEITETFVRELRLDASEAINPRELIRLAEKTAKPKLIRAAALTAAILERDLEGDVTP